MQRDLSTIHPDLRGAAESMLASDVGTLTLLMIRTAMIFMRAPKVSEDVSIEDRRFRVSNRAGKIRVRIYTLKSAGEAMPVLLWIHGGGYVLGKPEMDDLICADYARTVGVTVVSVDYRLAPLHKFPAALDDCHAALSWVHDNAHGLGVDPHRLAIGGASAGGGLAAALVQLAHDRGGVRPVFQLLVYPMLDDLTSQRARDLPKHVGWSAASNRFCWHAYLGKLHDSAYAVPARRSDLTGLPPAWIGVGTADLFHDEDVAYAERLSAAGARCELVRVPGAFHGFDAVAPTVPVVLEFRKSQVTALRAALLRGAS